ncbi:MAG: hypothetical protein LUQ09_05840 [Methanomassiliicoccales archaeon]|nr:hypothetical protein [Methanomassiliicoccales archaeon]
MTSEEDRCWELAWNDPTVRLLKRFHYHNIECLSELAGDKFYDMIRPMVLPSSMSASHIARETLGLQGNDLETNARLVTFGNDYFAYATTRLVSYERAFVKRVDRCILQDGPPEACFHCRSGGVMECSSTNPEHQMVMTATMPDGFRVCEYYITDRKHAISGPKDYGKKMRDLPPNPVPPEQRVRFTREVLSWYMSFVMQAIIDNFGIDEYQNRMRHRLLYEGMRYAVIDAGKEGNASDLEKIVLGAMKVMGMSFKTRTEGGSSFITVSSCPFSCFPPYFCQMIETFFSGVCRWEGKDREIVQLLRITEGGSQTCQYVLRLKAYESVRWSDK